jgi:hypothetical protein
MIDPHTGLAVTTGFQFMDMRTVLVLRRDRMPITVEQVSILGDYFCHLTSEFGGDDDANIHRRSMTEAAFVRRLESYAEESSCGPW